MACTERCFAPRCWISCAFEFRIGRVELAFRVAANDGHLLPEVDGDEACLGSTSFPIACELTCCFPLSIERCPIGWQFPAALQRGSSKNHADCTEGASEIIFFKMFNGLMSVRQRAGPKTPRRALDKPDNVISCPVPRNGGPDRRRGKAELTRHPTAPSIVHYRTMSEMQHCSRGAILLL